MTLRSQASKQARLHGVKTRFLEWFRRLRAKCRLERDVAVTREPGSLVDFFRSAPTGGEELDLGRKRDRTRTIEW